jgi:hypothetical protein
MVSIYDERGELVSTVCGALSFSNGATFSMTVSNFVPNPNGPGGTISIYLNGQMVGTWNATNSNGNWVPNGFYHFVLLEHASGGSIVQMERDAFISTYHGELVTLIAWPNVVHPGDAVNFTASFAGIPADNQSKIKIYATDGELVQTVTLNAGSATWDLRNSSGQMVASGVYLAVLDSVDPSTGQGLNKIVKVLLTH